MTGQLTGGSIRILWGADDSAEVTITGGVSSWTVNGSAVTFPYTLSSSTTFETAHSGTYTVSVQHHGHEVANTPDGTREVELRFGEQAVFEPTVDDTGGGQWMADLHRELSATYATRGQVRSQVQADGTDQTTVLVAEMEALLAFGGGTIILPTGDITLSPFTIPNDEGSPVPKHGPIRLKGTGVQWAARASTDPAPGGTVLDIIGTDTYGKIKDNAVGLLGIEDITFTDTAGSTTPFIYTTNATLHLRGNTFLGTKFRTACDQDAIILGGPNQVEGGDEWTDGFQGYGTVIRDNYFGGIRRAVVFQAFANAVQVTQNTVWQTCGNSAGGAIEVDGKPTTGAQTVAGGSISQNLIELPGYKYGITLRNVQVMTLAHNDFYDATATTVAGIYLAPTALHNHIIGGFCPVYLIPQVHDESTGRNTISDSNDTAEVVNIQPKPFQFRNFAMFAAKDGVGALALDKQGDAAFLRAHQGANPYPRAYIGAYAGTVVTDGVTTNGSTVVTSATAAWTSEDVGRPIQGTGLPDNAYIARRVSATEIWLSAPATATATGVTLNFGRWQAIQDLLRLERGHIVAQGSAPTVTMRTGAGTGATGSVTGADMTGLLTLNIGTSTAAGELVRITTALAFTGTHHPVICPANAAAATLASTGGGVFVTRVSSTVWAISSVNAPVASTPLQFTYLDMQAA